ncbi:TPA: hypothetical protein ACGUM0_004133 [Vibrio vulnificus]
MKSRILVASLALASFSSLAWEIDGHVYSIAGENNSKAVLSYWNGGQATVVRFMLPKDYGRTGSRCVINVDGQKANDGMAFYYLTSNRTFEVTVAYNQVHETWDGKRTASLRSVRQPPVQNQLKRGNKATLKCANDSGMDSFDFSLIGFTAAFSNLYK